MSDYDRYDFVISMLVGLIMVGALLLGAPLWTLPLFLAIGVTISLYRHLPLPPRRR
jgi:hypothetical protein